MKSKFSSRLLFFVSCCIMIIEITLWLLTKYGYYNLSNIGIHMIIFTISYLIFGITLSRKAANDWLPEIPFFNKPTKTPLKMKKVFFVLCIFLVLVSFCTCIFMNLFAFLKLSINESTSDTIFSVKSLIVTFLISKLIETIQKPAADNEKNIDIYGVGILFKSAICIIVLGTIIYTLLSGLNRPNLTVSFSLSILFFFGVFFYAIVDCDLPKIND